MAELDLEACRSRLREQLRWMLDVSIDDADLPHIHAVIEDIAALYEAVRAAQERQPASSPPPTGFVCTICEEYLIGAEAAVSHAIDRHQLLAPQEDGRG